MSNQTPFNAENSRTFVMPSPGGTSAAAQDRSAGVPTGIGGPDLYSGNTPLIAATNPLLNLVYQIRTLVHVADPDRLKGFLADEIRRFEASARNQGVSADHIVATRYCLCTVLDETATQTPWGGSGAWSRNSLLVTFHNETWGGEKFYQLLAKLAQSPAQHVDVLEVMYFCISLGFEGRYRIVANGQSQLENLKRRLGDIIRNVRGVPDRRLSPHWEGHAAELPKMWQSIPVWVSAATALVLAVGTYVALSFYLSSRSDTNFMEIGALRLPEMTAVARNTPPPVRFSRFLEQEIKQGLVSVREGAGQSTVIINGDGLFDSGSASIRPQYVGIIKRITAAIDEVRGGVVVVGHTDDRPMRSIRFPSNWELSQERARVVSAQIERSLRDGRSVVAEGRGESEPISSNDTPAGRALNRRVEITVFASPAELSKEI